MIVRLEDFMTGNYMGCLVGFSPPIGFQRPFVLVANPGQPLTTYLPELLRVSVLQAEDQGGAAIRDGADIQ